MSRDRREPLSRKKQQVSAFVMTLALAMADAAHEVVPQVTGYLNSRAQANAATPIHAQSVNYLTQILDFVSQRPTTKENAHGKALLLAGALFLAGYVAHKKGELPHLGDAVMEGVRQHTRRKAGGIPPKSSYTGENAGGYYRERGTNDGGSNRSTGTGK